MKVCLPEEVIFIEASIINDISSLSGMWKHCTVSSVGCFRHFFEESGRETNFEDFEIADLDGTLKTFYAGAQKCDIRHLFPF
jgi:hypothetical protein